MWTARSHQPCHQCWWWHSSVQLAHQWWNSFSPHISVCALQSLSPWWSHQVLVQWQTQVWHSVCSTTKGQDTDLCGKGHTHGGMYDTTNTTYSQLHFQILTQMDTMEPWSPPANFYHFTPGLWVNFTGLIHPRQLKCHRYITNMEDGLVTIVDKHTFVKVSNKLSSAELANIRPEFNINTAKLEVTQHLKIPQFQPGTRYTHLWVNGLSSLQDLTETTKVLSEKYPRLLITYSTTRT